jgi:uncharacterized ion transporter superfamily protein YfcC
MAGRLWRSKLYDVFTIRAEDDPAREASWRKGRKLMVWLAVAMFVGLFGWGAQYFGWNDPHGKVQLALFTAYILGVVCGYKNKD